MEASSSSAIDAGVKDKILDLSTSNSEVLELIESKLGSDEVSALEMQAIQTLFSERQQRVSLLSNLIRSFYDTLANVVRNIRV